MRFFYLVSMLLVVIIGCTERNPMSDVNTELSNLEIYFIASEDSISTNLYKIKGDGSDLTTLLSFNSFIVGDLKISSDNSKFLIGNSAFAYKDSSYYYEYVFNSFVHLIWTPNGDEIIALIRQGGNDLDIIKTDLYGLNWQYLTENNVDDQYPVVSITDDQIYFDRDGDIYKMNLDGSNQSLFIDTTQILSNLKFNYDESLFSYTLLDTINFYHNWTTYIGNSSKPFLLNTNIQSDGNWSPVSSQIIFSDYQGIQLYKYENNSTSVIKPLETNISYSSIRWVPDGTKIIYYYNDNTDISNFYSGGLNIIDISTKKSFEIIKNKQYEILSGFCVLSKLAE